jgi:hypothetical protein
MILLKMVKYIIDARVKRGEFPPGHFALPLKSKLKAMKTKEQLKEEFDTLIVSYLFLCWGRKKTSKDEFLTLMSDFYDVVNNKIHLYCFSLFNSFDFIVEHSHKSGYSVEFNEQK